MVEFVDPVARGRTIREGLRLILWAILLILLVLVPEIILHP